MFLSQVESERERSLFANYALKQHKHNDDTHGFEINDAYWQGAPKEHKFSSSMLPALHFDMYSIAI